LGIETADVEKAREIRRQQIKDCVASVRITPGRHKTGGFMQRNRQLAFNVDKFAVYFDVVSFAGLRAKVGADLPIYRNPSSGDQFVALAAGRDSCGSEETIQPHG
jgi:hypothetical protein